MTQKTFTEKANKLFDNYDLPVNSDRYDRYIPIKYGKVLISSSWTTHLKAGNIHSKIRFSSDYNDGYQLNEIRKMGGQFDFNKINHKNNFYFENGEECLDELNEYINNIIYFLADHDEEDLKLKYLNGIAIINV